MYLTFLPVPSNQTAFPSISDSLLVYKMKIHNLGSIKYQHVEDSLGKSSLHSQNVVEYFAFILHSWKLNDHVSNLCEKCLLVR